MPADLRDRFIPADKQCAIDLDAALGTALDEAAAEEQDAEETTPRTLDPNSPEVVRNSNNTTPENIQNDNNKPQ